MNNTISPASNERSRIAAHGQHTDNGRPTGFSTITPFLAVRDARSAIRFIANVFGATVTSATEMPGPDGSPVVVHAEVCFDDGRIQVGEPSEAYGLVPPPTDGGTACYSLGIYVPDVDAVLDAAVAAGATVREPASTFVSGDRFASIIDPFGLRWSIMTRVEDLSEEESNERVAAWAAQQAKG